MHAIILAAGLGSRLAQHTTDTPKALVRVGDTPLLGHVFHFLQHPKITRRTVITGYCADQVQRFCATQSFEIETIFNPNFSQGSIRTIETALPQMTGDCLIMNVDHVYPPRLLNRFLDQANGITAACDRDRTLGADDMKVKSSPDGKLSAIRKTLTDFNWGYIGMSIIPSNMLSTYAEMVALTREKHGDTASVEWVLGEIAAAGQSVSIADLSGFGWFEVDTPADRDVLESHLQRDGDFLK